MRRPLLDTSFAALPLRPPDIDEGRTASFIARFNTPSVYAPDYRTTTVDFWEVECRGNDNNGRRCRAWISVYVRHDEFHPEPAPGLCHYCRTKSGRHDPGDRSIPGARKRLQLAKRDYYEDLRAQAYLGGETSAAVYIRAELYDAIDLLTARIREVAGHPPRTNPSRSASLRATRSAVPLRLRSPSPFPGAALTMDLLS